MDIQKFSYFVHNISIEKSVNHFLNLGFISDDERSITALGNRVRSVFSGQEVPDKSEILVYLSIFSFSLSIKEVNLILDYLYDGKTFISEKNPIDILYYQHYRQHFTNHIEFLEMMTYINCLYMGNDVSGTYPDKYVDYLKSLFIGTNIDIFTWKNELELYMDRIKSSLEEILSSIRIYLSDYSLKDNSIDQYIKKEFALKKLPISLRQMTVLRIFIIIFLALQEKLKGNQIINSLPENTLHEFFEEVIDSTFERYILARIFS